MVMFLFEPLNDLLLARCSVRVVKELPIFNLSALGSARQRGEVGAVRVVGSEVVIFEVVSGIADAGFDEVTEDLLKRLRKILRVILCRLHMTPAVNFRQHIDLAELIDVVDVHVDPVPRRIRLGP